MSSLRVPYLWRLGSYKTAAILLFVAAAVLRLAVVDRPSLWADEVFTLAIATGHSLEHPAIEADEARGDFVEVRGPVPAAHWRRYLRHDDPPAGPRRVIRAVRLSDTNPPLYYLLVYAWSRLAGTSDAALRVLSVVWALASFPLIWAIGRRMGGRRTALAACWLYAFAPLSLSYSLEVRMYSLLWFLGVLLVYLTLRLHRHGTRVWPTLLWCATAAAGLLTHYFFVFVLTAILVWLVLYPGNAARPALVVAAAVVGTLVLPWYVSIPETVGRWRVTAGWLDDPLGARQLLRAPLDLVWGHLTGRSTAAGFWPKALVAAIGLVVVGRGWLPSLFTPRRRVLWLWLLAPPLGLVVFDVLRGTYTAQIPRYALTGLPATHLLAGLVMSRFRPGIAAALLALVTASWVPGLRVALGDTARAGQPYRDIARVLSDWAGPSDIVIVHSTPSGILGVARYASAELELVGWVGRLGQRRVPDDLHHVLAGRDRAAVLTIVTYAGPAPQEEWLRAHVPLLGERHFGRARVSFFDVRPLTTGTR